MIFSEVALRYSKALFNLASSKEERKKWLDDLNQVVDVLNQDSSTTSSIMHFFASPQIPQKRKNKVLEATLGQHLDHQLLLFLVLLLEKRRFQHLPEIVEDYGRMVTKEEGFLEGLLVTATPIDKTIKEQLQAKLENIYQKKLIIKEKVDPQLIGGGVLTVANQRIDFSLSGKLAKLKADLLSINVGERRQHAT